MPGHIHPPHAHPHDRAALSLLRFSVQQRLACASVGIGLIWLGVIWALA